MPSFQQRVANLALPMPLEALLLRANNRKSNAEALTAWEGLVKLMACAGWAACKAQQLQSEGLVETCKRLRRPSFGHWAGLLRQSAALLSHAEGPVAAQMRPLLEGLGLSIEEWPTPLQALRAGLEDAGVQVQGKRIADLLGAVVTYRNRTHGHSESVPPRVLEANVPLLLAGLVAMMPVCPPIGSYRSVAVREVVREAAGFTARLHLLHGAHGEPFDRPIRLGLERQLQPESAFLWYGPDDRYEQDLYLPLWAIALAVPDEPSGGWGLALLRDQARGPEFRYQAPWNETVSREVDPPSYEALLGVGEVSTGHSLPDDALAMEPWRGLAPYEEAHQALFFGRDREIAEVLSHLDDRGAVVVCGASGSGKSSLIRAGVVPALRQRSQQEGLSFSAVVFRPGGDPLGALRTALRSISGDLESVSAAADWAAAVDHHLPAKTARIAATALANLLDGLRKQGRATVLVVDQFEETVTAGAPADEAACFLELFSTLAERSKAQETPLLCTVRSDLLDGLLGQAASLKVLREHLYLLGPVGRDQIESIVLEPLRGRHVQAEARLAERIAADVGDEPGSLALLSQVLTTLWDRRGDYGDRLTVKGYEAAGGVSGAVSKLAEEARAKVGEEHRPALDRLLVSLATVGEGAAFLRKQMPLSALCEAVGLSETSLRALIEPFVQRRLMVLNAASETDSDGGETVEVAHEALLRSWPYYQQLLAEQREILELLADLGRASSAWAAAGRGRRELWTDSTSRLRRCEELRDAGRLPLTELQRDFLAASRRRVRYRRRLAVGAVAAIALLAVLAGWQWLRAEEHSRIARKNERAAAKAAAKATEQAQKALRSDYASHIALAEIEIGRANIARARTLLRRCPADLRHYEWHRLWTIADVSLLTLRGHERWVFSVSFSPDGKRIVSGSRDGTLKIWDAEKGGKALMTLPGHEGCVSSVAFSRNGKRIVSGELKESELDGGSPYATLKVWDAEKGGEALLTLREESGITDVSFSPNSKLIVWGSNDNTLKVWDAEKGGLMTLCGHTGPVNSVSFSPDGKRIVSGSQDNSVKVWDAERGGEPLRTLSEHKSWVYSVDFGQDGRRIVSGSRDGTAKIWDAKKGDQALLTLRGHKACVYSVDFSPDGKRIATGGWDGTVKIWDAEKGGKALLTLRGHEAPVTSVSFSPDGKRIVSGSTDNTVKTWDPKKGDEALLTLAGHGGRVRSVGFSPDGKRIVSDGVDGTLKIWDANKGGEALGTLPWFDTSTCWSVTFSPDGKRLAMDSRYSERFSPDYVVKIYNVEAMWEEPVADDVQALRAALGVPKLGPNQPSQRPGGVGIPVPAAGLKQGQRRRDGGEKDGKALLTLTLCGHKSYVLAVAFSWDGKRIASGSKDRTVKIWDAEKRDKAIQTLRGHTGEVYSVAFSRDGKRIVSGSKDRTVKIWDAENGGEALLTLGEHTDAVRSVGLSPDGRRIVSGCEDGTLRIWYADGRPE